MSKRLLILASVMVSVCPMLAQLGTAGEVTPVGKDFSLIYVESVSPGLPEKLKSYLFEKVDSIAANSFMLYISNSLADEGRKSDYYTKSKSSAQKRLSKLDDESLPRPDLYSDARYIWKVLGKDDFSVYNAINLHYYFTPGYVNDYILTESSACFLLNFLPKEMSLVSKNAPVTVNIYTSEPDPKKAVALRAALMKKLLFKNEGLFELKGLKCNIIIL